MPPDEPLSPAAALRRWFCRLVVMAFALLYAVALLWRAISLIDWFGASAPLAGVFLIVLGLPWTLGASLFDDRWQPLAAALAPAITLLLLAFLCRRRRPARH